MAKQGARTGRFGKLGTVPWMVAQVPGFEMIKEVGRGGMSVVYLAEQIRTKDQYALKIILPGKEIDDYSKTVFVRELEHLKILDHPHIVKIYDSGFTPKKLYLVLQYCDGGTLREWLHRDKEPLTIAESVAIALPILNALEYAHGVTIPNVELENGDIEEYVGLVHRDIKPENIFLCKGQEEDEFIVKLGDFGLSKAFNSSGLSGKTLTGTLGGTPGFIPRQQLLNYKYVKPEVDIWAVAACFYYMLTLKTPREFDTGNCYDSLMKNDCVPIRQRDETIPEDLALLLDQTLDDRQDLLFKSAAGFRDALLDITARYLDA